jgi:hypothetical protein
VEREYIHADELPAIIQGDFAEYQALAGSIDHKTGLPAGLLADTTAANFPTRRGGYHCRHQLVPVGEMEGKVMLPDRKLFSRTQLNDDLIPSIQKAKWMNSDHVDPDVNNVDEVGMLLLPLPRLGLGLSAKVTRLLSKPLRIAGNAILEKWIEADVKQVVERKLLDIGLPKPRIIEVPKGFWLNPDALEKGRIAEKLCGSNLHLNFPVIDEFRNGLATSYKLKSLNTKTHLDPKKLLRILKSEIDKLVEFTGGKLGSDKITSKEIQEKSIDVIIDFDNFTIEQLNVLKGASVYAEEQSIKFKITFLR